MTKPYTTKHLFKVFGDANSLATWISEANQAVLTKDEDGYNECMSAAVGNLKLIANSLGYRIERITEEE